MPFTAETETTIEPMAEFKFTCPQCKQHIQCDASYVGSPINCPACKQSIVVPPVPPSVVAPGERVIQIKVSTLRMAGLLALSVLMAAGIIMAAVHFLAGPKTLTFKAYVDGSDIIKLRGGQLWIEHQDWQLPARMTINGKKWSPAWDGKTSQPYDLRPAFRPHNAEKIRLTKRLGRGAISIPERPTPANQETLSIKLDDGDFGAADWYEFVVSW
jgi:DNA-directed RNA polymerase subunit RPC12/RpoP